MGMMVEVECGRYINMDDIREVVCHRGTITITRGNGTKEQVKGDLDTVRSWFMPVIPATSGHFVLSLHKTQEGAMSCNKHPIVAWCVGSGRAWPITPDGTRMLANIAYPDERVGFNSTYWNSMVSWLEHMKRHWEKRAQEEPTPVRPNGWN